MVSLEYTLRNVYFGNNSNKIFSISTDFMVNAFEKFGFGPDFVKWVHVLTKNTKSCIN